MFCSWRFHTSCCKCSPGLLRPCLEGMVVAANVVWFVLWVYYTGLFLVYRVVLSEDCVVIGSTRTTTLEARIRQFILQTFHVSVETATVFYRVSIKGETYYSRSTKARNSYTIEYDCGRRQAFIEYFLSFSSHTAAVVTPLQLTDKNCYPSTLRVLRRCIVPVCVESFVPLSSLVRKCVCLSLPETTNIPFEKQSSLFRLDCTYMIVMLVASSGKLDTSLPNKLEFCKCCLYQAWTFSQQAWTISSLLMYVA